MTNLEWRGLKVTHAMEVVCDRAAEVRDFEFDSNLVNGQRPKVRASVEMECSTLCRERSKREWGQGGDTCGKLKRLGEEVRRWCCNRWVTGVIGVVRRIFKRLLVIKGNHVVRVGHVELKSKGKIMVFLRPVKPPANLGVVILIVAGTARDFDLGYMSMLSPVC